MKPSSSNGTNNGKRDGSSSPSKRSQNNLVLHVEDKFDFENALSLENEPTMATTIKNGQCVVSDPDNNNKNICSPTTIGAASYYSANNFEENGYVFDGVKIDIEDIDNTSVSNMTTQSLKRCKSQVLKHYYRLLCFIGWRPFYKEHYYPTPFVITIINYIYPLLIVSLLFYAYTYDIVTCQAKLNIALDTQSITPPLAKTPTTTPFLNDPNEQGKQQQQQQQHLWSDSLFNRKALNSSRTIDTDNEVGGLVKRDDDQCGHILTTYILPSIMHLVAYVIGFIYFRINENEQLYALMEKVFLAVNQTLKTVSQDRVIKRLKIFIFLGVFWVVLAMSLNVMSRAAFGLEKPMFEPQWTSILLEFVALVVLCSVYLAVVINHATQCEMIIFYVNEIRTRLEEKSVTLKDAMQQILDIRMAIANLNSTVSKMTTLVTLIFIEKFMIGFIILILNRVYTPLAWIYRGSFVLSWFLILSFTLIQVARLNNKCGKFKQIALSARVYGYHACSRDELDSFLLFISSARLRAKLLGVSIKPSFIIGSLILISFVIIVLFQTSLVSSPSSIV